VSATADPSRLHARSASDVATEADLSSRPSLVGNHSSSRSEKLLETVVTPERGLLDWRLRQLWRYRDLLVLFVWRDFVAVYKQTVLGPAWHIARPLLATFVLTLVFSRFAGLSTDGVPAFLFYLSGFILWTYFASALENVSKTFIANANLLGKVYFHRLVIPISLILSNAVALCIQFALLMIIVIPYYVSTDTTIHVTWWLAATPILVAITAGYALAIGLIVCAVTTRFRDLSYLVTFGLQLVMFLTPVIYPVSAVPLRYRAWLKLNPLTPVIEAFRTGVLGVGTVQISDVAWSGAAMILVLVIALVAFTRAERTFVDTV
jgi:lipopolysaccharide transport system permease protein